MGGQGRTREVKPEVNSEVESNLILILVLVLDPVTLLASDTGIRTLDSGSRTQTQEPGLWTLDPGLRLRTLDPD